MLSGDNGCWFALKVFHNKAAKLKADLTSEFGIECYMPLEKVIVELPGGKRVSKTKPAIAGILFLHCHMSALRAIKARILGDAMFYPRPDGTPAVIPPHEMAMFRLVTSSGENGLEYLSDTSVNYSVGQRVRVLGGPFEGAEGHICRIKGNRRLVVSIHGICAVATSYIPACFLEKVQ